MARLRQAGLRRRGTIPVENENRLPEKLEHLTPTFLGRSSDRLTENRCDTNAWELATFFQHWQNGESGGSQQTQSVLENPAIWNFLCIVGRNLAVPRVMMAPNLGEW